MIDTSEWEEFKVGKLFRLESTKGKCSDDLIEGNDVPYVAASLNNNGVAMMCQKEGFEDQISHGNCVVFILQGEGAAGDALYMDRDFIGMSTVKCGYIDGVLNPLIGNFLVTLLCMNKQYYNHGRGWGKTLPTTSIRLPVRHNDDGSIYIDQHRTYSDDGYVPNWAWMESYIRSLHSKRITTKSRAENAMHFDTSRWKWFQLGGKNGLFEVKKGKRLTSAEQTDGNTPYIGAIDSNNGLANLIGQSPIHSGNTISLSYNGSVGEAFYQPVPFWATDDVNVLYLHKKYGTLNPLTGLFVCTVLKNEKYRYAYGRKWTLENMNATEIKLPATTAGTPDWQWMENYMKSLPYSDRIV